MTAITPPMDEPAENMKKVSKMEEEKLARNDRVFKGRQVWLISIYRISNGQILRG